MELHGAPTASGGNRTTVQREQSGFREVIRRTAPDTTISRSYQGLFNGFAVESDELDISRLERSPEVKAIYPVVPVEAPHVVVATPAQTSPTSRIGTDDAYGNVGLSGEGVKVGIIDTGIDLDHPSFGGTGVETIRAAMERAYLDGMDVVNMSFEAEFQAWRPRPPA